MLKSFSGTRSTSWKMKQSQFASFRASRYPTFSSLARLNLVLPACGREWKKPLKKVSDHLNENCSWAFVLIMKFPTTFVCHSLYSSNYTKSCPKTLGTASEWPGMQSVSSVSTCHEHTQPGSRKPADIWAPEVRVLHDAISLLLLLLSWSSHWAT